MERAKQQYDLTQGGILGKLLMVALPIMGTQFLQMAYNLTDMFWLGRVGSDTVAATGTAGLFLFLSQAISHFGRTGAEIGVSQSLGLGDRDTARDYAQNAMTLAISLGILYGSIVLIFRHQMIGFFNLREAHVAADSAKYLAITGLAIPSTYITAVVAGTFNASGNSRTPFLINAVGLVVNVVLDPLLIFGLEMGIVGAAVATTVAQVLVSILSIFAIKSKRLRPLDDFHFRMHFDKEKLRQIFRWSTPVAMESFCFSILTMTFSRRVAAFGSDAISVNRVGTQVESLSWLISAGFSSALTAYVGQNCGAGKWTRIRRGVWLSSMIMAIWGLIVTFVLFFAGGWMFSLLLPDPRLYEMGREYVRILAYTQIFATLEGVASGTFRGIGRTLPPSVASIVANVLRVFLIYGLSYTSLGLSGIWWGITIGGGSRGLWILVWMLIMFRRQPKYDLPVEKPAQESV